MQIIIRFCKLNLASSIVSKTYFYKMAFNLSNVSFVSWEELDLICGNKQEATFSDFERLPHSTPISYRSLYINQEIRKTARRRLVFEDSFEAAPDNWSPTLLTLKIKKCWTTLWI